jgi:hypothetical protein
MISREIPAVESYGMGLARARGSMSQAPDDFGLERKGRFKQKRLS